MHIAGHGIKSALMTEPQELIEIVAHAGEIPGNSHFGLTEPWNNVRIERYGTDILADILHSRPLDIGKQQGVFGFVVPSMPDVCLPFFFGEGGTTVAVSCSEI